MRVLFVLMIALLGCSNGATRGEVSPAAADAPPEYDERLIEQRIHRGINAIRSERGLAPLDWDEPLADVARSHSRDMGRSGDFSHYGSDGSAPSDRAGAAGYECLKDEGEYRYTGIAENIFMTYVYASHRTEYGPGGPRRTYAWKTVDEIADGVVQGWMDSPGHRANILERRHDRQGIGVVRSGDQLYITQNLC